MQGFCTVRIELRAWDQQDQNTFQLKVKPIHYSGNRIQLPDIMKQ